MYNQSINLIGWTHSPNAHHHPHPTPTPTPPTPKQNQLQNKGFLWNSAQNMLSIYWKIPYLYNAENWRALRSMSSYETPLRTHRKLRQDINCNEIGNELNERCTTWFSFRISVVEHIYQWLFLVYWKCYPLKWSALSRLSKNPKHNIDVIMGTIASQITSLTIVYSTVYSDANQRKHQNSASLAFVLGIHRWPVNSPHKWPVTRKMFPFDDVIMKDVLWAPEDTKWLEVYEIPCFTRFVSTPTLSPLMSPQFVGFNKSSYIISSGELS